jgi:hypothetical protein
MVVPSIELPTLLALLALPLLLLAPPARAGDLHKCHRPWPAGGEGAEGKPLDLNVLTRLNRDVLSTQAAAAHRVRSTIGDIEDAHVHADVTFGGLAATVRLAHGCTTVLRAPPVSEGALVGANGARLATGDALPESCQVRLPLSLLLSSSPYPAAAGAPAAAAFPLALALLSRATLLSPFFLDTIERERACVHVFFACSARVRARARARARREREEKKRTENTE